LAHGGFWAKTPPLAARPSTPGSTRQLATFREQEWVRATLNAKSASNKAQPGMRATWTAKLKTYHNKQGTRSENLAKKYTKNTQGKKHNHNKQFWKLEKVEKNWT